MSVEHSEPLPDGQSILEHLNELRVRIMWAAVALAIGTVISFIFADELLLFIKAFYPSQLQTLSPTEGLETYFKISLVAGAMLAMPVIVLQFWLFIAPGLEPSEKRYVYVFVPSAVLLFAIGVSFAWFVLLPSALQFLGSFLSDIFRPEWTSQEYIGFVSTFLFWIGVSFEMPLIIFILARLGFVTAATLRDQWRLALVIIAVIAAAVTPSIDPVTMLLTMVPLMVLYAISILLAMLGQRRFARAHAIDEEAA